MTGIIVQVYINPQILVSQLSHTLASFHASSQLFFEASGQYGLLSTKSGLFCLCSLTSEDP